MATIEHGALPPFGYEPLELSYDDPPNNATLLANTIHPRATVEKLDIPAMNVKELLTPRQTYTVNVARNHLVQWEEKLNREFRRNRPTNNEDLQVAVKKAKTLLRRSTKLTRTRRKKIGGYSFKLQGLDAVSTKYS